MRKLGGLLLSILLLASSTAASRTSEPDGSSELVGLAGAEAAAESYEPLPDDPFRGVYFVTQQYRDMLGREPDAEGLAFWTERLEQGLGPAALVASFVDSPEFAQSRLPVARLYLAALGRMPEEDGWAYWSAVLNQGSPLSDLAVSFIETPEGRLRLGVDDPDELIEALYQNVLDRNPDAEGAAYWRSQLATGVSRAEVVVSFAESEEFRGQVDSTIRASLLYSGLLGRESEPEGLEYWDGELRRGAAFEGVVGGFVGSPEYKNRLTGLWCNIIDESEMDIFDGPDRSELDRDEWLDDGYRRMRENGQAINDSLGNANFDELRFDALDWWPDRQYLFAIHTDAMESSCLTFLGRAPHPNQVTFLRAPYLLSELDEVIVDIRARLEDEHPSTLKGISVDLRVHLELAGPALPAVDGILDDYAEYIESLSVGLFPYPMPDPLPEPLCLSAPDAVDPATLGLQVNIDLESETIEAGLTTTGTFTVTNVGTDTYSVRWGFEAMGHLGTGDTSSSVLIVGRDRPENTSPLTPGSSVTGRFGIGTNSCDPSNGHRLPAGEYPVWGTIWIREDNDFDGTVTDYWIWLPAETVTVTH